jgi:hypothetical protein
MFSEKHLFSTCNYVFQIIALIIAFSSIPIFAYRKSIKKLDKEIMSFLAVTRCQPINLVGMRAPKPQ